MAYRRIAGLCRTRSSTPVRHSINGIAQRRNWSTASIPDWDPTPSPELNAKLQLIRERLFIPQSLSNGQQNLVFKLSHSWRLEENPIIVHVGPNEEPYRLRPIDRLELPRKKEITTIVDLMKQTKHWTNFVPLLIGVRESGWRLNEDQLIQMVTNTGATNGLGYLSEAMKQHKQTSFTLGHPKLGKRLFFELHVQAQQAGFQGPKFESAFRLAQQFATALEEPQNATRKGRWRIMTEPAIIAVLLELCAADVVYGGNTTRNRETMGYARRFRASWYRAGTVGSDLRRPKTWARYDEMLQELVPVYNALKLAMQVRPVAAHKEMSALFKNEIEKIHVYITKAKQYAHDRPATERLPGLMQAHALHEP
ncbi:hypothetical protein BJX64DRAFT_292048 [Aspergillus heterothallicus]